MSEVNMNDFVLARSTLYRKFEVNRLGQVRTTYVRKYTPKNPTPENQPHNKGDQTITYGRQYSKSGYKQVSRYLVHRLVAEAFIPNPDPAKYTEVNHKDFNPSNNNVENLEWCTREFNKNYHSPEFNESRKIGAEASAKVNRKKMRITYPDGTTQDFNSCRDVAQKFGVSPSYITMWHNKGNICFGGCKIERI